MRLFLRQRNNKTICCQYYRQENIGINGQKSSLETKSNQSLVSTLPSNTQIFVLIYDFSLDFRPKSRLMRFLAENYSTDYLMIYLLTDIVFSSEPESLNSGKKCHKNLWTDCVIQILEWIPQLIWGKKVRNETNG